jgi:hypothetical protein
MKLNIPSIDHLSGWVIRHLPDSIAERKELLTDLLRLLPYTHPLRIQVAELLNALKQHEQHQLSLSLDFQKSAQPKAGDGNGSNP